MHPGPKRELRVPAQVDLEHLFLHVLYDLPVMQAAATIVCDELRGTFLEDIEFHTVWTQFQHLADAHYLREAAEVAAQADVVIVATACRDSLPGPVAGWLGSWICQRHKVDSALCGLFQVRPGPEICLPPVAALLASGARLTGREWMVGCVRKEAEIPRVPLPHAAPRFVDTLVHVPVAHGLND